MDEQHGCHDCEFDLLLEIKGGVRSYHCILGEKCFFTKGLNANGSLCAKWKPDEIDRLRAKLQRVENLRDRWFQIASDNPEEEEYRVFARNLDAALKG